jgi:hypothetical protein
MLLVDLGYAVMERETIFREPIVYRRELQVHSISFIFEI